MTKLIAPYFPIIYVRGYAMTPNEVSATVSTPYMGFNLGSVKARQAWDGRVKRHVFESPVIRLMKDYKYHDTYANGTEISDRLPAKSIVIYRYYEEADHDLGAGNVPSIVESAIGLKKLIYKLREQVCGEDKALLSQFKVHLVSHSMGGLVCRAFLQNDSISTLEDRELVDKVFTYATPHNGIDMGGINVPSVLGLWDLNNFNRKNMAEYLDFGHTPNRVDSLDGKFDPQRFFCFVGTNHRDYEVAFGLSRRLAGEMSDGLVRIENATLSESPRAFAFRSHSGPYGVVNSEEGYQNLVRFLFGDLRIDGKLEIEALPLPPSVQKAKKDNKNIRSSYYIEATVAPRGAYNFRLTERRRDAHSAILRKFDELFAPDKLSLSKPRSPTIFSAFLDTRKIVTGKTVVFSVELGISSTGYTIDKVLWDQHVEGEYLFRDTLTIRATPTKDGWNLRFLNTDEKWSEGIGRLATKERDDYVIPLASEKGFKAKLRLKIERQHT
ncbi:TPA: esterase/lipase family protein [Vibrio parahaemolyticus]